MPYRKHPSQNEYPQYYEQYIALTRNIKDIIAQLKRQQTQVLDLISNLREEELSATYAEGKWSIKELLIHIIDTERIFAYRALSFARGEKNALSGFDHNEYVSESFAVTKSKMQLKEEYETNRKSTIALFRGLEDEGLNRFGVANGLEISVRAMLYIIAGHEMHHLNVLEEKYL